MQVVVRGLMLGVAALLGGCGSDEDGGLDRPCAILQKNCQRVVFDATAEMRGNAGLPMPPVRIMSVEEFADFLEAGDETGSDEPDVWSKVLPLLNLLPKNTSIAEQSNSIAVEGVAAFYSTETKTVTVLDRATADARDGVFTLAHEFAHAIQDAEEDLAAFDETWGSSFDSSVAIDHLVEGEATVLAAAVLGRALGATPLELNWDGLTGALRRSLFETVLSSQTPLLAAAFTAPYALGTAQLAPLWLRNRQAAIDPFYDAPRLSVLDWDEFTRVTDASRVQPLACYPTAGPPGFTARGTDSLGPIGVFAATSPANGGGGAIESAWTFGFHVRDDRLVTFVEDASEDSYAIAWRTRFDSEWSATEFQNRMAASLPATAAITRQEREVVVYGTTQPDRLALWTNATHCGTAAELPAPREQPERDQSLLRRPATRRALALTASRNARALTRTP